MRVVYGRTIAGACAWAWLALQCAFAQSTLVLRNDFIDTYKNRVTIDTDFIIDHAHKYPNPVSKGGEDGDLHFSGRSAGIGLPMVVEIVNAALPSQKAAVAFVHQKEGKNATVSVRGVWRIWFEHPPAGHGTQIQGEQVPVPDDTNPDHVFELHPVMQIGPDSVLQSFIPIPKYQAYDAQTAFEFYESLQATVQASGSTTIIQSKRAVYNYAEFFIQLMAPPLKVADGYLVLSTVQDAEGSTVAKELRRMVFAAGTAPAEMVQKLKKGDRMHVMGIPRINLERISFATNSSGGKPVKVPLPYEMIIMGVFPN